MHSISRAALAAFALLCASAGWAQVPRLSPNVPLYTNGTVYAVARLPDNSTVIGGSFTKVNDTPRQNLAKLLPNGDLDSTWTASADNRVNDLAVDGSGNVIVAGEFLSANGFARYFLAKVSGTGTGALDTTWNPSPNGSVNTIVIDGNGNIVCGGLFNHIGGQDRAGIARVSGSGTGNADATWNPSADGSFFALAIDASGNVYAAGNFENIGGQVRHYLAKLSGTGQGLADATWNPSLTGDVYALAIDGANVIAGGYFTNIGGQTRYNISKLSGSGTGAAVAGWIPVVNSVVEDIAIDGSGTVFIGGDFSVVNSWIVGGVAKLSGVDGAVDQSWHARANSTVYSVVIDGSANVRVGGGFSAMEFMTAGGFAIVNGMSDTLVAQATTDAPGYAWAVARQSDGGLIVGGHFWKAGAVSRHDLLRLRSDGTLDPDWNPSPEGFSYGGVYTLALDGSDHVYVGGLYTSIGGQDRIGIAKLAAHGTGAADATWDAAVDGSVGAIALDESGGVLIGGSFTNAGGQPRSNIARLSASGTGAADMAWNAAADDSVYSLSIDSAGDIYASGRFNNIGGQAQKYLAKLSPVTGAAYATWDPVLDASVSVVCAQTDGTVYAGGFFTHVDTILRGGIARLSGSGTGLLDATWNPNPSIHGNVSTVVTDAAGDVYVGGDFDTMGAQPRNNIAKLSRLGTGLALNWNPGITGGLGRVSALVADPNGYIDVVGPFTVVGGQQRGGIAVLPTQYDRIFSNAYE